MGVLLPGILFRCSVHSISLFCVQETKKKQQLKVKMQMAKFLQETINDMAVSSKNPDKKESVEEFARFFEKVQHFFSGI